MAVAIQKLNPNPSFPFLGSPDQVYDWSNQLNARLTQEFSANATRSNFLLPGSNPLRLALAAPTTFYVSTAGSDTNNGLTPTTPWATFAHAMSVITGTYDFGGQTVTLQAVAGSANFTGNLVVTPWTGGGTLVYDGANGSITYAGVASSDGAVFLAGGALPGPFVIQNVTLSSSTGASALFCSTILLQTASTLVMGTGVTFGSASFAQIHPNDGGCVVRFISPVSISGSAAAFIFGNGGTLANYGIALTVTYVANVTYSLANINSSTSSLIILGGGVKWVLNGNTVTGKRFNADTAGIINTQQGAPANLFPGTVAGTVTPPGVYI